MPAAIFLLTLFLASSSEPLKNAQTRSLSHRREVFQNDKNCRSNKTCDLKAVEYVVEDYEVGVGGESNYGTRLFAQYHVDSFAALEDYVFVQFIKGCQYETRMENGGVTPIFSVSRRHLGESKIFCHPDWEIDSIESDPAYASLSVSQAKEFFGGEGRKFARFAYLQWNDKGVPFVNLEDRKFYGREKPPTPSLYVTDHPSQAFVFGNSVKNVSLQFRMCIYKSSDVPYEMKPGQKLKAKPIHCFNWSSSFIYDHKRGQFYQSNRISPACKSK